MDQGIVTALHGGPQDGLRSLLPVVTRYAPLLLVYRSAGRAALYNLLGTDLRGTVHYRFRQTVAA